MEKIIILFQKNLSTEANQDRLEPKYNKDIWEDSNLYITRRDLVNNPKDKISYYFSIRNC